MARLYEKIEREMLVFCSRVFCGDSIESIELFGSSMKNSLLK